MECVIGHYLGPSRHLVLRSQTLSDESLAAPDYPQADGTLYDFSQLALVYGFPPSMIERLTRG